MSIELYRLLEITHDIDITLIAGENGIHNLVSWVHMIETTEAASFLDGGEIAVITGLGVNTEESLCVLLERIYEKQASGVIINIGPFLEEIPQSAIRFCNAHDLPLMQVPWRIHLAEIMRTFCSYITKEEQRYTQTASGFKNALFFPDEQELYVVPLSGRNFQPDWNYAVCVIHIDSTKPKPDMNARVERLSIQLDHYALHRQYKRCCIFQIDHEIVLITGNYEEQELIDFVNDMHAQLKKILQEEETISLGVGRMTQSIRCLYKSYRQAQSIQRLQANKKIDNSLFFYPQMGLYQLLMGIENADIAKDYRAQTLGPLIQYDKTNHSDLNVVLRSYLSHDGSVKDTADELYVHRNTVNYKLGKISELLQADLSSLQTRLQLMVAYMIQDMM